MPVQHSTEPVEPTAYADLEKINKYNNENSVENN